MKWKNPLQWVENSFHFGFHSFNPQRIDFSIISCWQQKKNVFLHRLINCNLVKCRDSENVNWYWLFTACFLVCVRVCSSFDIIFDVKIDVPNGAWQLFSYLFLFLSHSLYISMFFFFSLRFSMKTTRALITSKWNHFQRNNIMSYVCIMVE